MSEPAPSPAPGGVDFLAHQRGDDVAVAVRGHREFALTRLHPSA